MTKNELEGQRIKMAARLNEISGLDSDDFTEAIRTEASALEIEYRHTGTRLSAMLAVEDAERQVAEREAAELGSLGDSETRERSEIRSRTGLADFLAAAVASREVAGAAKEYADACGVSPLGLLPLDLFGNGKPETRAITAGPAVDGPVEPAVPYVFQRSAAASLGIQMPTHGAGAAAEVLETSRAAWAAIAREFNHNKEEDRTT